MGVPQYIMFHFNGLEVFYVQDHIMSMLTDEPLKSRF